MLAKAVDELTVPAELAMTTPALLQVRNLALQYKTWEHLVTATWNVNFDVQHGDRFVLLGPSGCGKSTLLKAVGGFMKPVVGRHDARRQTDQGGRDPTGMMVFQEFDNCCRGRPSGRMSCFRCA